MSKKPKKTIFFVLLVVVLLLLCCGVPSIFSFFNFKNKDEIILGFSEPPWLYTSEDLETFNFEMELMELLEIDLGENYLESVMEDVEEDFEVKEGVVEKKEEERVEVKTYSSEFFPEFSFEYSGWKLDERLSDSKLVGNGKDLELTLEKDNYILRINLTTLGPAGFEPICYKEGEIAYTRIQGDTVRAFDGISYSYGYMYDQEHETESFEMAKEMYFGEEGYFACGDTNILGITSTTFFDEEFFSQDYLSAIMSAKLHEKGDKNESIIKQADEIIKKLVSVQGLEP